MACLDLLLSVERLMRQEHDCSQQHLASRRQVDEVCFVFCLAIPMVEILKALNLNESFHEGCDLKK